MKNKFQTIWRRFFASYLRAVGAVIVGVQAGAALNWVDAKLTQQIGMALMGALVAPAAKALMESADAIDPPAEEVVIAVVAPAPVARKTKPTVTP